MSIPESDLFTYDEFKEVINSYSNCFFIDKPTNNKNNPGNYGNMMIFVGRHSKLTGSLRYPSALIGSGIIDTHYHLIEALAILIESKHDVQARILAAAIFGTVFFTPNQIKGSINWLKIYFPYINNHTPITWVDWKHLSTYTFNGCVHKSFILIPEEPKITSD